MGSAQSIPPPIESCQPLTTSPPRNKLTKPRTNTNASRETSCLPSLPLSLSRSTLLGNSKSSSIANRQTMVESQSSESIFAIEYSQTTSPSAPNRQSGKWDQFGDHPSTHPVRIDELHSNAMCDMDVASPVVVSPTLVGSGMLRRGSMVTHSSANSSSACAPNPNRNSEISSMGTVRRRSQLLAAPPATATRKPTKSHRHSMDISDITPDPFTLAIPVGNDNGRCTTPSGYSVLGAFKRGSLRIANGAASPAPSSCPGSPDASARDEIFGPTFTVLDSGDSRPPSRVKPMIVVSIPGIHEVRLVPPSPTDWKHVDDERTPGSPFSFVQSPSVYDEETLDLPQERGHIGYRAPESSHPIASGPVNNCENPVSTTPSTLSSELEYHRIHTEQCLNRRSVESVIIEVESSKETLKLPNFKTDEYHDVLWGEARKENERRLRRPSMTKVNSESTDSGYSSSGSVDSWKVPQSNPRMESKPIVRKLENPRLEPKSNSVLFIPGAEVAEETDKQSRTRSMVAAIRRRYSQGDLKASARSMEFKQPPVPAVPVVERRKTLTKFRPELRHRRSMIAVTRTPMTELGIQRPSSVIIPVPPLPHPSRLERKGSFNLLALEDYLPLVDDLPFTPIIDHTPNISITFSSGLETETQEPVIKIGVGRTLYRGSKITGQDYYQRFSRRQYARVETVVG